MFWSSSFSSTFSIDSILDRPVFTLEEILDDEIVVQECKSQNLRLIEYLSQPEILDKLIEYIITLPDQSIGMEDQFRYPSISAEILASGNFTIAEALVGNKRILDTLWGYFLGKDGDTHTLLISFVSNILISTFEKKPEEMVEYVKNYDNFVELLLNNMHVSVVGDLILRLCIRQDQPGFDNVNKWLLEQKLFVKMVSKLNPNYSELFHDNIGHCIKEILNNFDETMNGFQYEPVLVVQRIQSEELLQELMKNMILENNHSGLKNALDIIIFMLKTHHRTVQVLYTHKEIMDEYLKEEMDRVEKVVNAIAANLSKLHSIFTSLPSTNINLSNGSLPAVGTLRLNFLDFFLVLLEQYDPQIFLVVNQIGLHKTCMTLLETYHWNNLLHSAVEKIITIGIRPDTEGTNANDLFVSIFIDCLLREKMLELMKNSVDSITGKRTRGYTGHLYRLGLAVDVALNGPESHPCANQIPEIEGWDLFVAHAKKIRQENSTLLGEHEINMSVSAGDIDVEMNHDVATAANISSSIISNSSSGGDNGSGDGSEGGGGAAGLSSNKAKLSRIGTGPPNISKDDLYLNENDDNIADLALDKYMNQRITADLPDSFDVEVGKMEDDGISDEDDTGVDHEKDNVKLYTQEIDLDVPNSFIPDTSDITKIQERTETFVSAPATNTDDVDDFSDPWSNLEPNNINNSCFKENEFTTTTTTTDTSTKQNNADSDPFLPTFEDNGNSNSDIKKKISQTESDTAKKQDWNVDPFA